MIEKLEAAKAARLVCLCITKPYWVLMGPSEFFLGIFLSLSWPYLIIDYSH